MTFTPTQLKDRFRLDVMDVEGGTGGADFLWSDQEIYDYMDEAQRMFVRRTEILRKTSGFTPALTSITYTAPLGDPVDADGYITPHAKIIRPLRARMTVAANREPLDIVTAEDMDQGIYDKDYGTRFTQNWQDKAGPARYLVTNLTDTAWRLVPIPTVDDVVQLTVLHMPLNDVSATLAALEVTEREDQHIIKLWMKHLAFLKQDADIYDKELSDKFEAAFEKKADERRREIRRTRFRHTGMRYGGIEF